MNTEAALAPCNICDGTGFGHGPSRRLAITNRLPHCMTCDSLERHRIARRVFDRIQPYVTGKRLLQFSPDPAVDKRWFAELVVSVWEGDNSLDMQAIALPDGRYDWIYSSHVLNHVPDQAAALRDMLRVVGETGVVALSVGGTVFNYATKPSDKTFGKDYQFVLYGTEFADEIQAVLPEVAVLELVGADPCTASIDSIYFYSRNEQALLEMAQAVVGGNIHARVFRAVGPVVGARVTAPLGEPDQRAGVDTEPFAACNVCGATRFRRGPSERLSAPHHRSPLCEGCSSLERHRLMRRMFDALQPRYTHNNRALQVGSDPGLRVEWFSEFRSLDVSGLGVETKQLAAGRYDWVCSSHLVGDAAEESDTIAEMLRVAGAHGVLALSIRGTTSRYEKILSLTTEADLNSVRYHTDRDFASEFQRKFPHVALLELVAEEPSTASVDAIYFCSQDAALLQELGSVASESRIFARFFVALRPTASEGEASVNEAPWARFQAEIEAWRAAGHRARFWIRDDDATVFSDELAALTTLCRGESIPLALAVIPERTSQDLARALSQLPGITVLQHGFDHRNRSSTEPSSEFPDERPLDEALAAVRLGWSALSDQFGQQAIPVFVPPWGTCSSAVRQQLVQLGLRGFSGSQIGPFQPTELWRRGAATSKEGLRLGNAHVAVNRSKQSDTSPIPVARHIGFLADLVRAIRTSGDDRDEPIGIMTHAWGVDDAVRGFLRQLFYTTRKAGAEWVSAREIFGS